MTGSEPIIGADSRVTAEMIPAQWQGGEITFRCRLNSGSQDRSFCLSCVVSGVGKEVAGSSPDAARPGQRSY